MMEPDAVRCPVCLAKPGDPCKSVKSWMNGIVHGQGSICPPHESRRLKARVQASGLRILREKS